MRRHRAAFLFLAILIPLTALLPWTFLDQSYPVSDSSEYFETAYKIFWVWQKEGIFAGFKAAYLLRNWKPDILPVFGAVSALVTGGNVQWAVRLCNTTFFALFLYMLFLCLELFLPALESALATALIGVLPWSVSSAHYFGLEIPILFALAGGVYFLMRSRSFDSLNSATRLGLFWGAGLCFRPADVLLFFFIPVLYWTRAGILSRKLSFRDVIFAVASFCPLFVLLFFSGSYSLPLRLMLLLAPAILIYVLRTRLRLNSVFLRAILVSYLLVSVWYAPFLKELRAWVYDAGFSAAAEGVHPKLVGLEGAARFVHWLCGFPAVPLMAAAIVGLFGKRLSPLTYWIVAAVCFPVLAGAFSHDAAIRYYFGSATLMFSFLCYLALSQGGIAGVFRQRVVILTIALCLAWNLQTVFFPEAAVALLPLGTSKELYFSISPQTSDPRKMTIDVLADHLPKEPSKIAIYPFFPIQLMHYFYLPGTLSVVARERGYDWEFSEREPDAKTNLILVVQNADVGKEALSSINALAAWKVVSEFPWPERDQNIDSKVLILKRRE